jgi:hypothetical protein
MTRETDTGIVRFALTLSLHRVDVRPMGGDPSGRDAKAPSIKVFRKVFRRLRCPSGSSAAPFNHPERVRRAPGKVAGDLPKARG